MINEKTPPNNLAVIVDWNGTLADNPALAKKLAEFQRNGVDIYICSTDAPTDEKTAAWFKEMGLVIDPEKNYIDGSIKISPAFWQALPEKLSKPKENLIVLDDVLLICMSVNRLGITAVHWNNSSSMNQECIDNLATAAVEKGYRPL